MTTKRSLLNQAGCPEDKVPPLSRVCTVSMSSPATATTLSLTTSITLVNGLLAPAINANPKRALYDSPERGL